MKSNLQIQASQAKQEIIAKLSGAPFPPVNPNPNDAWQNPIAISYILNENILSDETRHLVEALETQVKLVVTEENAAILKAYYDERVLQNDTLAKHYQLIGFLGFLRRLYCARYRDVVLIEGCPATLKEVDNKLKEEKKYSIEKVGSILEAENTLTLEETALSPLVLPLGTTLMIGTGSRASNPSMKQIMQEYENSVDVACFAYPAGVDLREGSSIHFDANRILHTSKPLSAKKYFEKASPAFLKAMDAIYGPSLEARRAANEKCQTMELKLYGSDSVTFDMDAYFNRCRSMLKALLISVDLEMLEKGLGKTFQLKGIGLGLFGLSRDPKAQSLLEEIYLEALNATLQEIDLLHIDRIHLVNLPTRFRAKPDFEELNTIKTVKISASNMDPFDKTKDAALVGEVGGTVFCGNSGSLVGNGANSGAPRNSSDDPAQMFALLNPSVFDPQRNWNVLNVCITNSGKKIIEAADEKFAKSDKAQYFQDDRKDLRKYLRGKLGISKKKQDTQVTAPIGKVIPSSSASSSSASLLGGAFSASKSSVPSSLSSSYSPPPATTSSASASSSSSSSLSSSGIPSKEANQVLSFNLTPEVLDLLKDALQVTDKSVFKAKALSVMKDILNNDLLVHLVVQLESSWGKNSIHDRSFYPDGAFSGFRTHETSKTWAEILEAAHVRFFLNATGFGLDDSLLRVVDQTKYNPLMNNDGLNKWAKEMRTTKLVDDLMKCRQIYIDSEDEIDTSSYLADFEAIVNRYTKRFEEIFQDKTPVQEVGKGPSTSLSSTSQEAK